MNDRRDTLLSMYLANPDGLAVDLEILFEPCTDATYAALHNGAIQRIMDLCGEDVVEKDEAGFTKRSGRVLKCKFPLAKHLARNILMYARMQK